MKLRRLVCLLLGLCAPRVATADEAKPAADAAQDKTIGDLQKDLEKTKNANETLAKALDEKTSDPAERVMRHGLTVGAAYTVHYGVGGEPRLHGLQGGSLTGYVAMFPAYWLSSAGANAYCAAQWSASEASARSAEVSNSVEANAAERLLRVVKLDLDEEKKSLEARRKTLASRLKAAAGPTCFPTADAEPPVTRDQDPGLWNLWCSGQLQIADVPAAATQINAHRKKVADAKKLPPEKPDETNKALSDKLDKIQASLDAQKPDIRGALKTIHCPNVERAARALERQPSDVLPVDIANACTAFPNTLDPEQRRRIRDLNLVAADHQLAAVLTALNDRTSKQLASELDIPATEDRRAALRALSNSKWNDLAHVDVFLDDMSETESRSLRRLVILQTVDAWSAPEPLTTPNDVLLQHDRLRAVYRREILHRATRDLDEEADKIPLTHPAMCIPNKLGAYVGVGTPFEATVYAPGIPGGGLVRREVTPTLAFGAAIAPNALFSLLVGVSIGGMERDSSDEEGNGSTEPIVMGSIGLGGNIDLASVLK